MIYIMFQSTWIFMPRLEASRPRLVGRSVGLSVGLQNKFCYEVAFKTRFAFKTSFAMKLASKQGLLSKQVLLWSCLQNKVCFHERDISPKHKQTSKQKQFLFISSKHKRNVSGFKLPSKQKQFLLIYSYPLSNRGGMARISSAAVLGIHDDVILASADPQWLSTPHSQLMVSQAGWP